MTSGLRARAGAARALTLALLVSVVPGAVPAADSDGKFAMKGAGLLPCRVYLSERERRSNVYYMIGGWVEGYVSAHNRHSEQTFDILSFESLELMLEIAERQCRENPDARLHEVLHAIIRQVERDRLESESPRVQIGTGERRTALYRETIRRVQERLRELGRFGEDADGRFTPQTRDALAAYQEDIGFEPTGFPDQATLWRLLRGPDPD